MGDGHTEAWVTVRTRGKTWTQACLRGSLLSHPPTPHSTTPGNTGDSGKLNSGKARSLAIHFLHLLSPKILNCPWAVHELGNEHYEANAWENITAVRLGGDSHHWQLLLLLLIFKSGSFSTVSISSNQENTTSQKWKSLYSVYIHF